MAYIDQTLVGSHIRLTQNVHKYENGVWVGTFTQGHVFKILADRDQEIDLQDDAGRTLTIAYDHHTNTWPFERAYFSIR
jgi:hypothetical protein